MHIALVGTRGVPASYGGFETAVEEIGQRLVRYGHDVTVYCRNQGQTRRRYLGMELVNLPALHRRSLETLSHTALSTVHELLVPADVAVVFNAANAPFVPLLHRRGVPVALHMDGLEWKRGKWGAVGRRYYLACERLGARVADVLIADAEAIRDYYVSEHHVGATFIPYGAPHLHPSASSVRELTELRLEPQGYHLVVARFEPENNLEIIVEGYRSSGAELPLVIVGSATYGNRVTDYVRDVAVAVPGIRFTGYVAEQATLDALYLGCASYVHGHSVGGTNPSLLRALGAAAPVLALDNGFNREVAGAAGRYFSNPADVATLIAEIEADVDAGRERGREGQRDVVQRYAWDPVARAYEQLCRDLLERTGRADHDGFEDEDLPIDLRRAMSESTRPPREHVGTAGRPATASGR